MSMSDALNETQNIVYDPNIVRPAQVQARLDALSVERKGIAKNVLRDGVAPTPVMTTSCPHCKKACPITNKGFVCTSCVLLFRA